MNALFRGMADLEYPVDKIHGGMMQDERFEVMNAFKRGQFRYLIATDVAARGIDIENITHVINYDIPLEKKATSTAPAGPHARVKAAKRSRSLHRMSTNG